MKFSVGWAILSVVLTCASAHAQSLVVYDDFSAPLINPDKWLTDQARNHVEESARRIESGQLRLKTRVYGDTSSDVGTTFPGWFVSFSNPNAVTTIQTTVTVTRSEVAACPSNPDFTAAQTWLGGHFFNVDTPVPGSSIGDVFAAIFLTQTPSDPADQLLARFQVFECLDDFCVNTLAFGAGDLGAVTTGEPVALSLSWDQSNHQFVFQRDTNDPVVSSYSVSDTEGPGAAQKTFNIGGAVANCTATPRPMAFMSVLLGTVFVNP